MSKGGQTRIAETGTAASRVLFLSSGDATVVFNNNRSNFMFDLDEDIVVPNHHSMLISMISAEIPYSFYNFVDSRNTLLYYQYTALPGSTTYVAGVLSPFSIVDLKPEGNWSATELAAYITAAINSQQSLAANTFQMIYDPIAQKFKFIMSAQGRITLAMKNSPNINIDMNEEIGFDLDSDTTPGDPFIEYNNTGPLNRFGYVNPAVPGGTGIGTNVYTDAGGATPVTPPTFYNFLYADDCADMSNSIRTLFIRSNLTTNSVMDSHVGGGFSNILAQIPIDGEPGSIINVKPADGDVHKCLLKVKEFTQIHLRLTNQRNQEINLNGLTYNISLKIEFIENTQLEEPENIRELVEEARKIDNELALTKKKNKTKKDKKS
tara:strand:+ start:2504 stop:3637 length:1134 start_codon:yes stop_codon:yes gene_type:complete